MSDLNELQRAVDLLIAKRNRIVAVAEKMVQAANQEFDSDAVPLIRRLSHLKTQEARRVASQVSEPPKRTRYAPRAVSLVGTEDWPEDDQSHYAELYRQLRIRRGK